MSDTDAPSDLTATDAAADAAARTSSERRRIAGWFGLAALVIIILVLLLLGQDCCQDRIPGPGKAPAKAPEATIPPAAPVVTPESPGAVMDYGRFNENPSAGTQSQLPGPKTTIVPDVMGLTVPEARAKAQAAGMRLDPTPRPSGFSIDHVWQQHPAAGTTALLGSDLAVLYGYAGN